MATCSNSRTPGLLCVSLAAIAFLFGCAESADPAKDIQAAVTILVCRSDPGSNTDVVMDVIKDARALPNKATIGQEVRFPLVDPKFVAENPIRIVFLGATDPRIAEVFAGPRSEYPVRDGKIPAYRGMSLAAFRDLCATGAPRAN